MLNLRWSRQDFEEKSEEYAKFSNGCACVGLLGRVETILYFKVAERECKRL